MPAKGFHTVASLTGSQGSWLCLSSTACQAFLLPKQLLARAMTQPVLLLPSAQSTSASLSQACDGAAQACSTVLLLAELHTFKVCHFVQLH